MTDLEEGEISDNDTRIVDSNSRDLQRRVDCNKSRVSRPNRIYDEPFENSHGGEGMIRDGKITRPRQTGLRGPRNYYQEFDQVDDTDPWPGDEDIRIPLSRLKVPSHWGHDEHEFQYGRQPQPQRYPRIPFSSRTRRYSSGHREHDRPSSFRETAPFNNQGILPDPPDLPLFFKNHDRNFNRRNHPRGFDLERDWKDREVRNRTNSHLFDHKEAIEKIRDQYRDHRGGNQHFRGNYNNPRPKSMFVDEENRREYRPGFDEHFTEKYNASYSPKDTRLIDKVLRQKKDTETTKVSDLSQADEYDLDNFQLLLERHRLIQQQLAAIGRHERDLEESILSNRYLDDDPDFVVIPNPNQIENEPVLDYNSVVDTAQYFGQAGPQNLVLNENYGTEIEQLIDSPGVQGLYSQSREDESSKLNCSGDQRNFVEQQSLQGRHEPLLIEDKDVASAANSANENTYLESRQIVELPSNEQNQQQPRKKGGRRRQRRKKWRNMNPNLKAVPKSQLEQRKVVAKRTVTLPERGKDVALALTKKRKLDVDPQRDNYQPIPMDVEDEYEEIDNLLEDDYYARTTQECEPQVASEPPKIEQGEEAASQEETTQIEATTNIIKSIRADDSQLNVSESKTQAEDDIEDDLLLREQLLQSLATKRAEKARAMMADQQSPSSSPQMSVESPGTSMVAATKEIPVKHTPVAVKPLPRVNSNSDSLRKSRSLLVDSVPPPIEHHEKVIIQIGQESDTDDSHDDDDNEDTRDNGWNSDFMLNAINDLLREARHGSKVQNTRQADVKVPEIEQKGPGAVGMLVTNLQNCILNANAKLQRNREDAQKDDSTIKLLLKKIGLRKTRISQQEAKIKRLKQLLLTAEKAKKTLNSQCLEFQGQVQSLRQRINIRNDRSKELDEELIRAKMALNAATKKGHVMEGPTMFIPNVSQSKLESSKAVDEPESKSFVADQLKQSVEKLKLLLSKKTQPLHPTRRKSRHSKEEKAKAYPSRARRKSGTAPLSITKQKQDSSNVTLKNEKERLQKLERELREQLEQMKRASGTTSSFIKNEAVAQNVSRQQSQGDNYSHVISSPKRAAAHRESLRKLRGKLEKMKRNAGGTRKEALLPAKVLQLNFNDQGLTTYYTSGKGSSQLNSESPGKSSEVEYESSDDLRKVLVQMKKQSITKAISKENHVAGVDELDVNSVKKTDSVKFPLKDGEQTREGNTLVANSNDEMEAFSITLTGSQNNEKHLNDLIETKGLAISGENRFQGVLRERQTNDVEGSVADKRRCHVGKKSEHSDGSGSKLNSLFQDRAKLEKIREEQLKREALQPNPEQLSLVLNPRLTTRNLRDQIEKELLVHDSTLGTQTKDRSTETNTRRMHQRHDTYKSSLLLFRSYRLSPWYRTKEKLAVESRTYSHKINPAERICPYDWSGKCLDENCTEQHASETFSLSDDELLHDLILYKPSVAGVTEEDSSDLVFQKIDEYIAKLRGLYDGKLNFDQLVVLLINDIKNELSDKDKGKMPSAYNMILSKRIPLRNDLKESNLENDVKYKSRTWIMEEKNNKHRTDADLEESQELRYFEEDYDIEKALEKSVEENSSDITSWISLAKHSMKNRNSKDGDRSTAAENEDQALNILSKALEANPHSEDLWVLYLDIFSRRNDNLELREMCIQAVDYCRSYTIWWKCLQLEENYDDKIEVCLDVVDFLLENPEETNYELRSHRILETTIHILHLEVSKQDFKSAVGALRSALEIDNGNELSQVSLPVLLDDLTIGDQVTLWLSYISIAAFERLPSKLFDPADNGPSKIVSKTVGIFQWDSKMHLPEDDIRSFFEDALKSVENHGHFQEEYIQDFLQIYANRMQFEVSCGQLLNALLVAKSLSSNFGNCPAVSLLIIKIIAGKLHDMEDKTREDFDSMIQLQNDECVFEYANYLLSKKTKDHSIQLLKDAVVRKFDFEEMSESRNSNSRSHEVDAIRLYQTLLKISTELSVRTPHLSDQFEVDSSKGDYAYLWLNYCLLLELTESPSETLVYTTAAEEAYQIAVNTYTSRANRKTIWLQYLRYKQRQLEISESKAEGFRSLLDAAKRCLVCMPSDTAMPFEANKYWSDFSFHNQVVVLCLEYLPVSRLANFFKDNLQMMPTNTELAICLIQSPCKKSLFIKAVFTDLIVDNKVKLNKEDFLMNLCISGRKTCLHALQENNIDQARNIYGFVIKKCPHALDIWRMAICVELKSNGIREARWLYEEATKMLPYCAALWKDYVMFEITHGQDPKKIQTKLLEIATKATSYGIVIMDFVRAILRS